MFRFLFNSIRTRNMFTGLFLVAMSLTFPLTAGAAKKKKATTEPVADVGPRKFAFDPTKLVWPSPPNIGRIHWLDYFAGAKIDFTPAANAKTEVKLDGQAGRRTIGDGKD